MGYLKYFYDLPHLYLLPPVDQRMVVHAGGSVGADELAQAVFMGLAAFWLDDYLVRLDQ